MGKWIVAKYIRLSQADRDLRQNERKQESNSISHQRDMLETYIAGHQDLAECEQMEFLDDGFSGTAFDRPGFEKLLEMVRRQEITCIIVKDFSRFGRDYIELGDYLERIFPLLGVRFISVNDHYDSLDYKGTTGGLDVVMKNIVYAYYSKDLSVKVKTAKRAKMKRGELISGQPLYGYVLDPADRRKIIIDPEAAVVVREIYDAFLSGKKMYEIADMLNQKGCESPSAYYCRKNPQSRLFRNTSTFSGWNSPAIRKILTRKTYYGAYEGHLIEVHEVGSDRGITVPEDEQIVIEGSHEPIVTKEEYLEVQKQITRRGNGKKMEALHYPLRGKVRCGTCGRSCRRMLKNPTTNPHQVYLCKFSKHQLNEPRCTIDDIDETKLEDIVWNEIQRMITLSRVAQRKMKESRKKAERSHEMLERHLGKVRKEKEKAEAERIALTERFLLEEISREEYQRNKVTSDIRLEQASAEIETVEKQLEDMKTWQNTDVERDMERIQKYVGAEELTEELVGALVDKVLFYDKEHIEICWRLSDGFLELVGLK